MRKSKWYKHKKHQQYMNRKNLRKRKKRRKRCFNFVSHVRRVRFGSLPGEYKYTSTKKNERYNAFSVQLILSEKDVYPDKKPIDVNKALAMYSREDIIKIVFTLNKLYGNSDVHNLHLFFSPENKNIECDLTERILRFQKRNSQDVNHIFSSYQTGLEILRHTFALPSNETSRYSAHDFEETMMRIILSLNHIFTDYNLKEENRNADNLIFINKASNKYILKLTDEEIKNQFLIQLYMGYSFFMFITSNANYEPMYVKFLQKYKTDNWRKYFITIIGLVLGCKGLVARYDPNLEMDVDKILDNKVVDELCWDYNSILKYKSDSANDRQGNSDYRYFRSKPLIKMKNGDIVVTNKSLLIDKLYNSLYFDFMEIAQESGKKGFDQIYTSNFIEKTLFDKLIEQCASDGRYTLVSEEQCKENHKEANGELGPPDYILKTENSNILFECKDIRLNGWILEQRNYELLIDEIQNKLLQKRWIYENGARVEKTVDKRKPIGVGQLAGNVKNIYEGKFKYSEIDKDKLLYTVLVLGDRKLNFDGFHHIANRWFSAELKDYKRTKIKPVIIVTLGTLFKYGKLFKQDGFEKYFDEYIKSVDIPYTQLADIANRSMSFDDYMTKYPYSVLENGDTIMKELLRDRC